jgi:hypothetical protein
MLEAAKMLGATEVLDKRIALDVLLATVRKSLSEMRPEGQLRGEAAPPRYLSGEE